MLSDSDRQVVLDAAESAFPTAHIGAVMWDGEIEKIAIQMKAPWRFGSENHVYTFAVASVALAFSSAIIKPARKAQFEAIGLDQVTAAIYKGAAVVRSRQVNLAAQGKDYMRDVAPVFTEESIEPVVLERILLMFIDEIFASEGNKLTEKELVSRVGGWIWDRLDESSDLRVTPEFRHAARLISGSHVMRGFWNHWE